MEKDKLITLNIKPELHKQFKVATALNRETMTEVIIKAIQDYIKKK